MRYLATAAMLAAMAGLAFAQDPYGNRMNHQYPVGGQQEQVARPFGESGLPPANGNRMNVVYGDGCTCGELIGWPSPYENRMNLQWPKAQPKAEPKAEPKVQPKEIERPLVDP